MAVRFPGQQIQSWNPATDPRSEESGRLQVLKGKNYIFDSKGPKSGFGSRLVRGGALGNLTDIQSVDVDNQTLVFSSDGIYRQEYALPAVADVLEPSTWWRKLASFTNPGQLAFGRSKWYGAYLKGGAFIGNQVRGLYSVKRLAAELHTVDGVPANPIAIDVVASRLCVINRLVLAWSGPGDGNDFVPASGGAGFQLHSQYMAGTPIGITSSENELVVWSKNSAMVAEYVGGTAVFRFAPFNAGVYPLGPMAMTQYLQGSAFIMTRHGLVLASGTKIDPSVSPDFNQFIRTMLNENHSLLVRLDYIKEDDLLYVQLADTANVYQSTYVLNVGIDKWGEFSEEHIGVCRFGELRGSTGYADVDGRVHKFTNTPDRETKTGELIGLDSYIDLGYLDFPDIVKEADSILEMQEVVVSAREQFPVNAISTVVDLQGAGDWWGVGTGDYENEDWNDGPTLVWSEDWNSDQDELTVIDDDLNDLDEDLIVDNDGDFLDEEELELVGMDFNNPIYPDEDWNLDFVTAAGQDFNQQTVDESEDYLDRPITSVVVPSPFEYEDWNLNTGDLDEDWNGPYSFYNGLQYKLLCMSSMNGEEYDIDVIPELAIEKYNRDLWTMITSGRFQAIRFSAVDRWDYYHVTQIDASLSYMGQYS